MRARLQASTPITVSGAVDSNYAFSYIPGVLTMTGNALPAASSPPAGYLGALASASNVGTVNGFGVGVGGEGAEAGLSIDSSPDSTTGGPFSEERAFDTRTHASDYLPNLSLEILNGGVKMPAGVP